MESKYKTITVRNGNRVIISTHTIVIVLMQIFMLLRLYIKVTNAAMVLLITIINIVTLFLFSDMFRNNDKSDYIKYVSYEAFLINYILIMVDSDNALVYTFAMPMILAASIYRDIAYSIITSGSYLIVVIAIVILGIHTGKFGYIDLNTSILQIVSSITIAVTNIILTKVRDLNYLTQIKELEDSKEKIEYAYNHDLYTGLYNRNYLMNNMNNLFTISRLPISIAVINANGLKLINDFYGNKVGDAVIAGMGKIIRQRLDDTYTVIHLNSDEYMILLYNTEENAAMEIMEDIRKAINITSISGIQVSAEYGIAVMSDINITLDSCITLAKNVLYQKKLMSKNSVKSRLIESLKQSLSESDFETEEHAERTKDMAVRLAKRLGLSDDEQSKISLLAILHDIGKMSIPREILLKPGKLTDEEWEIMKTHTNKGYEIANQSLELKPIADYILHHHEKWDGTGYPEGLKEDNIPLLSRIITVVDSHDVMTHNRPYHKAMSNSEAKEELIRCSGTQFDPNIVNVFISMLDENTKQEVS